MEGLKEIMKRWPDTDRVILLSESDYPVKSAEYIKQYLSSKGEVDFEIATPLPDENPMRSPGGYWLEGGRRRLECYALRLGAKSIATIEPRRFNIGNIRQLGKVVIKNPRKIPAAIKIFLFNKKRRHPHGIVPCGGEFWFGLRGGTVRQILDFEKARPDFFDYHHWTSIPDEVLLPTLVHHLVPENEIAGHTLRYINWKENGSASPEYFKQDDEALLREKVMDKDCLFVRKVADEAVCDLIDRMVEDENC